MTSLLIFSSCSSKVNENLIKEQIEQQDKSLVSSSIDEKYFAESLERMNSNKENSIDKREWIEKTINKELMKTDADCGIASVKMLLGFYGMDVSYEDLGKKINTTTEGTNWEDIKKYFKTLDNVKILEYEDNLDKAKEYIEKGYPLLINWNVDEEEDNSHYSILIAIDKYSVWMLDPAEKKSLSEYSLDYFLPCWKNENYWFCILEEKDKKIVKQEQIINEKEIVNSKEPKKQITSSSEVENLVLGILTLMH